jgi:leader peptidase (prepilin peptidase) / N-methyltransferase
MTITLPLLVGLMGGAAGRLVSWIVDRATFDYRGRTKRLESLLSTTASAVLLAALAVRFEEPGIRLFVYGGLVLALIGVTVFDIRTHVIPYVVTIPGTVVGIIAGSLLLPLGIRQSVLGLLVGGGVLLLATVVEAIRKKQIGGGDWKYAAMIGSFIGPQRIVIALVLTGIFGLVGGIALAFAGLHSRPHALGPWLSAGAVASILLG